MPAKMRRCYYCGAELGLHRDYDPLDTCGKRECEQAASEAIAWADAEAREAAERDNYARYR